MSESEYPIAFAVGTGRCGTKCLSNLMGAIEGVASFHEINPLNETFHRFSKWYELPIDDQGFLFHKTEEIRSAQQNSSMFFEASAYLSLSVETLCEALDSKFVLMIRSPEKVVNSYKRKGWYEFPVQVADQGLIPGCQQHKQFHHYLGRTIPKDIPLDVWNGLSTVGKLGWYWSTLNLRVLENFHKIPSENWRIQKLEELTYEKFCSLSDFLGAANRISKAKFDEISLARPNAQSGVPESTTWSGKERSEFMSYVEHAAGVFNYSVRHIV